MSEQTIDLLSYLRQTDGFTEQTFNSLNFYGFDSSDTLMAMDIIKDLPQMTAISIGQRALLRQVITEYKTLILVDKNQLNGSADETTCDENRCHNSKIVNKFKELLECEGNERIGEIKDQLKKYRLALIRTKHQLLKCQTEGQTKDIELKKLNSEIFKLKNHKNYENLNTKFEKILKEKDINIKELEEKVSKLKRKNATFIDNFNDWHKKSFNDLNRLKTYLVNENMVIHKRETMADEEVVKSDETLPLICAKSKQKQSEPKLTQEVVPEDVRSEQNEDQVLNDTNNISFDESISSIIESQKSDISSTTSSQVIRVTKDNTFQYIPLEASEDNETDISFVEHNYSRDLVLETNSVSKRAFYRKPSQKIRSHSFSGINTRKRESNSLSESTPKKSKNKRVENEIKEEDNTSTHLVLISTKGPDNNPNEKSDQLLRRDSVTLSSITGSKLVSIDINGDTDHSDGNNTDTSSVMILKQNVVSGDNVSQIATSNGYLSDSNEENRCSIGNSATDLMITKVKDRHPVSGQAVVQKQINYKCELPDCEFVTLFENKFKDHIKNHVNFHFGQEIPDWWRPYYDKFRKDIKTKNN